MFGWKFFGTCFLISRSYIFSYLATPHQQQQKPKQVLYVCKRERSKKLNFVIVVSSSSKSDDATHKDSSIRFSYKRRAAGGM